MYNWYLPERESIIIFFSLLIFFHSPIILVLPKLPNVPSFNPVKEWIGMWSYTSFIILIYSSICFSDISEYAFSFSSLFYSYSFHQLYGPVYQLQLSLNTAKLLPNSCPNLTALNLSAMFQVFPNDNNNHSLPDPINLMLFKLYLHKYSSPMDM